jgi:hypothetical protein
MAFPASAPAVGRLGPAYWLALWTDWRIDVPATAESAKVVAMRSEWLRGVSAGEWISERLHPWLTDTGSMVPEGFNSYVRILHPVEIDGARRHGRRWLSGTGESSIPRCCSI